MKKYTIRTIVFAAVFTVSYLGISISRQQVKVAGETSDVTLVTLGMQAKAYCNEAGVGEGYNDGKCTGAHNDSDTRCLLPAIGVEKNCKRDLTL
jgi:hypothetical protein